MPSVTLPRSGVMDGINSFVLPSFDNSQMMKHLGYRPNYVLRTFIDRAKSEVLGEREIIRHKVKKVQATTTYRHLDPVSAVGHGDLFATEWKSTNWSTGVLLSEEEIFETTVPGAVLSRVQHSYMEAMKDHERTIMLDLLRGNALNSNLWYGLEQVFYPKTHLNAAGSTASALARLDRTWKARQANNTIGGIARSAHTDFESAGGTGLEPYSVNYFNSADNDIKYVSGAPGVGLQVLIQLCRAVEDECGERVDTLYSDNKPIDDYLFAVLEKTTVNRDVNAYTGGQLAGDRDVLKFMDKMWHCSEDFRTQQNFSAISDDNSASGTSNIYGIVSKHFEVVLDSRLKMKQSSPRQMYAQHGTVTYIQTRGRTRVKGVPGFRCFGIGA